MFWLLLQSVYGYMNTGYKTYAELCVGSWRLLSVVVENLAVDGIDRRLRSLDLRTNIDILTDYTECKTNQ